MRRISSTQGASVSTTARSCIWARVTARSYRMRPALLPFPWVPFRLHLASSCPPFLRIVCYSLAMAVPHFGHCRCAHGTPRPCGSRCPHFGHRQVPPTPAARGPPMRPGLPPPRPRPSPPPGPLGPVPSLLGIVISSFPEGSPSLPWSSPPPGPIPPRRFPFKRYSSFPVLRIPRRRRPLRLQPGMTKVSDSRLPPSQA